MGIGIDLVYIPRVRGKETLAKRILSAEELVIYQKRLDKDTFLAGRFAAKEAFFKAMHEKLKTIPFRAVSTINPNCPTSSASSPYQRPAPVRP
mgnify:CR=1 FL=1